MKDWRVLAFLMRKQQFSWIKTRLVCYAVLQIKDINKKLLDNLWIFVQCVRKLLWAKVIHNVIKMSQQVVIQVRKLCHAGFSCDVYCGLFYVVCWMCWCRIWIIRWNHRGCEEKGMEFKKWYGFKSFHHFRIHIKFLSFLFASHFCLFFFIISLERYSWCLM